MKKFQNQFINLLFLWDLYTQVTYALGYTQNKAFGNSKTKE
jgi:hypothetical protein